MTRDEDNAVDGRFPPASQETWPMIVYDLECAGGHRFEGWFDSADAFEEQGRKGLVSCPLCNDTVVKRVMSPVAVRKSSAPAEGGPLPIDYRKLAREVLNYIQDKFENVGPRFTSEALKIHHGVAEHRNIRGSATEEEEKILKDEGVEYFKLPSPKVEDKEKN
jgi:hypothetical protein